MDTNRLFDLAMKPAINTPILIQQKAHDFKGFLLFLGMEKQLE